MAKRVFPPEWYAHQAARRKRKGFGLRRAKIYKSKVKSALVRYEEFAPHSEGRIKARADYNKARAKLKEINKARVIKYDK